MKPALLIIDMQKDFYEAGTTCARSLDDAVENINPVIAFFRKKELPVICVQQMEMEDNLVPGEQKFEVLDSLAILPSDVHIVKTYSNAFNKTPLAGKLAELHVDTVLITGFCAEYCVLSTTRGAADLDLKPILIKNCLASGNPANIRFVEEIHDLITFGALKKLLE